MLNVLLVGTGGFVGSAARYLVNVGVSRLFGEAWLPYGTLTVNIAGCFAIGVLSGLADARQIFGPEVRLVLIVGLLGGFTTYSTFGYDTLTLLRGDGGVSAAIAYVLLHIVLGLVAVAIGHTLTT